MFDLHAMTLGTLVATMVQLGIPFVGLLAIVVLRFLRRGAARFALTPAMAAIVLFPIALACAITSLAAREVLRGLTMSGAGGIAAISAGLAECMVALMIGFGSSVILGPVAWLAVAAGTSRVQAEASGTGISTPASLLVSGGLTGGLFVFLWSLVTEVSSFNASASLSTRINIALAGSAALCVLLAAIVLVSPWAAPRGRSPIVVSLLSLGMLAVPIVGSLAGLWVVHRRMDCFQQAAMTGTACDDLDMLPSLATGAPAITAEPAPPAFPPPPPPPPLPLSATSRAQTKTITSASDETAVRVGGAIREPKKLKDVRPVYPAIARQARVQGVVILECRIGPRGDVVDVKVLRGIPLLEAAAKDAVRQWRYTPTLLNGVPASVIMTVTVNFHLS